MPLRFFTLAVSLLGSTYSIFAQSPTPLPHGGYVRFWNMLPPATGSFQLLKAEKDGGVLATATAYSYSSYVGFPIGQYQLSIVKSGTITPLKNLSVDLKADTYFTIVLAPQGNGFKVEFFEDTFDPQKSVEEVTFRNYFPGTSISVLFRNQSLAQGIAYGNFYTAKRLPEKKMPMTIQTTLPGGKSAQAAVDLDLTISKHATVLIIPDSYGRFRARVTADGANL